MNAAVSSNALHVCFNMLILVSFDSWMRRGFDWQVIHSFLQPFLGSVCLLPFQAHLSVLSSGSDP